MATVTTTRTLLDNGVSEAVELTNTGSVDCWVTHGEYRNDLLTPYDAPMRITTYGRPVFAVTRSGSTTVDVDVIADEAGVSGPVLDGGTP